MFEEWRDIKGYEGLYQISNIGRVKSIERTSYNGYKQIRQPELIKKPLLKPNGYLSVALYNGGSEKRHYVHRLVCASFCDGEEMMDVNHKNGDKQDNRAENLEWCTRSQNINHAREIGIRKTGGNHSCSKLNEYQVDFIKNNYKRYDKKYGSAPIGRLFGVSHQLVSMIAGGKHR